MLVSPEVCSAAPGVSAHAFSTASGAAFSARLFMTKFQRLRLAVKTHIETIEGLMKGPSSDERGQAIARSISELESVLSAVQGPSEETDEATSLRCPAGAAFHKRNRFTPWRFPTHGDAHAH